MSVVTNIVLSISSWDGGEPGGKLADVNRYFEDRCRGLVSVDDPSLPERWYGGNKWLETSLFVGAFNAPCLGCLEAFMAHLRSIAWEHPEAVQLFVKEQEDDRFRVIDLLDGARA
jgi:hypothetical protein